MRYWLCVIAVAAALPARAADEPKLNTLTAKEIADGWLLLFDGETTFGWHVEGEAKAADGVLTLGGDKETTVTMAPGYFDLSWQYRYEGGASPKHTVTAFKGGKRVGETDGGFSQSSRDGKAEWSTERWKVRPNPRGGVGTESKFGGGAGAGMVLDSVTDLPEGCHVGLRITVPKGTRLSLRDVKLRPTGLKPLFNGKDLTGWKVYDGDKARTKADFSVTKDGLLHMKGGPGDLQTEGHYDDFVLQLECKTNGKHLNSGVFFRCIPGQYQNGYEAQIHNNFTADPPKEYAVEVFDPKTHESKDKLKVKSAAPDFGTGAIYRRVPARKGVANDNEWFTLTVVARGRHIATWVNGVQQVDWTDNRPLSENPRNGCRLDKGAISLQGHDPTTDILFRNFRIAELPKAEK
jgi:hypothetical protein